VALEPDVVAEDPTIPTRLVAGLRERGVLTRLLADGALQISPPFVITREELNGLGAAIGDTLTSLGSTAAPVDAPVDRLLPDVTSDESGGFGSSDRRLLAEVPPHHGR
jgi:hypothetical protein